MKPVASAIARAVHVARQPVALPRWLDALLLSGWIAGCGVGGTMLFYGAWAHEPTTHLIPPNSVPPGTLVWAINRVLRVSLFGTLLTAFMVRLLEHRTAPREQRLAMLRRLLRAHSGTAALGLLCIVVVGGLRDVLQAELFDRRYGQNLYLAPLDVRELLDATCISLAAALAYVALNPRRRAPASPPAEQDVDGTLSRATTWIVALLLVAIWVRGALVTSWVPQDRHHEALAMHAGNWELIVAALLLAADDPLCPGTSWSGWFGRNLEPLRLLVMLELLRVAGRQEWYLDMQWFPPHGEHTEERLLLFDGRLDNVVSLAWRSAFLASAAALMWAHSQRRTESHAAVDGDAL